MNTKSSLFGNASVNTPVVATLPIADITPDPEQPRKVFDKTALKELATTIKEKGLIQPIIVRSAEQAGKYIIIAGERRWRAVQLNNAETIQAVVRDDLDARAAALIENIQRQNLKPVEEAEAIARLMDNQNLSQGEAATLLGMGRASVNQLLKLKDLPEDIKEESLSLDTPKTILVELCSVKDHTAIKKLWKRSKKESLSLAEIRRVRDAVKHKKPIEPQLRTQEKALRKVSDGLEALKLHPLSEADRARLSELQATIIILLEE